MADETWVPLDEFKEALASAGGAGSRTAAELEDDRLQAHLNQAATVVAGRLNRYTIALDGDGKPVDLIQTIVVGIAGYTATLEYFGSQPLEPTDPVNLRYQYALGLLKQLADGVLVVAGVDAATPGEAGGEPEVYDPTPYLYIAEGWVADEERVATFPGRSGYLPSGNW